MKTHVEFRSDLFPPYDGEDDEVNPGIYGKRLAEYLARGLAESGFEPLEPIAEDWGWVVPIKNDGFRLWIGCANYDRTGTGRDRGFLCFIEPHRSTIRGFLCFRKIDTSAKVGALQAALDGLLSSTTEVHQVRWWTYDEFIGGTG